MKNKNIAIICFVLAAIGAAYLYYLHLQAAKKNKGVGNRDEANGGGNGAEKERLKEFSKEISIPVHPIFKNTKSAFPLKFGSRGKEVKVLQEIVMVKPDGVWGPKTGKAIYDQLGYSVVSQREYENIAARNGF